MDMKLYLNATVFNVCVYGFSQVLNTPVVTVYRFGIYGFCFFTGYFIFLHDEVVERLSKWWGIFLIVAGATGIFYTIYYFGENYAVEPVLNNLPACIYCWFSILAILALIFGITKVGEKGQIVIPAKARKIFDIQPGDNLIILGDESQGIAIIKEKRLVEILSGKE